MSETHQTQRGILFIVACAAGTASSVPILVQAAQASGWDVYVVPTPRATDFLGIPLLEQLTGHPVRCDYRKPDEPDDTVPRADALIAVGPRLCQVALLPYSQIFPLCNDFPPDVNIH